MLRDVDENALLERFSKKYSLVQNALLIEIERSNCGCDYGSTSYTTLEQVKTMASMLALRPGKHLLDIGAGSGWPGLYLAKQTGCDLSLTDLPIEGLQVARERATTEPPPGVCNLVVASGVALPFPRCLFDAISHADVLCCLVEKLKVLQACRTVVNPAGRMVFTVLLTTPGLSGDDYRKAVASGPSFIAADDDYPNLMRAAGWKLVRQIDLSEEFHVTLQVIRENELKHAAALEKLLGVEESERRFQRNEATLDGLDRGLIRRELFHAQPA